MTSINELPPVGNTQQHAVLTAGMKVLSGDQHVAFDLYRRWIHPIDGMAYWMKVLPGAASAQTLLGGGLAYQTVKAGESIQIVAGGVGAANITGGRIVNPLAPSDQGLPNAEPLYVSAAGPAYSSAGHDTVELEPGDEFDFPANPTEGVWVTAASGGHAFTVIVENAVSALSGMPLSLSQAGSLHYSTVTEQSEDSTVDSNTVLFTSDDEVQPFNLIGSDELYIGKRDNIRFAFSSRGLYYEEADIHHYVGQALFSVNRTQVIDDPAAWAPTVVVSNSLPIWLGMPGYVPPYPTFRCPIALYPSYLVTDNLAPPFGAVHVEKTENLQMTAQFHRKDWSSDQLTRDAVRVTLYGADADVAQTFVAFVEQYSVDWGLIGMANSPTVTDEKRTQPEFKILAQKKTIAFDVNYFQSVARAEARQLIRNAIVTFMPTQPPEPGAIVTPH
jgi:hypothetical protein